MDITTPNQCRMHGGRARGWCRVAGDLELHLMETPDGNQRIAWCSEWARIGELVDAGLLRRHHHGPATYGHITYVIVEAA